MSLHGRKKKVYTVHDFFPILSCQAVGVENSSEDLVCHV